LNSFLLVFLGGGTGAACRHGINLLAARLVGTHYPFGTFLINIVGSFLIGVVVEYCALRSDVPLDARLFIVTGIIGGFTTFSAFSLEIGLLFERGEATAAIMYALSSVLFGVTALFAGLLVVRHFS
jgi:CrcB protein